VAGCEQLVRGGRVDADLLNALAGPAASRFLTEERDGDYWLRVWGARGLLRVWDGTSVNALRTALGDEHWRVREMALKATARHGVDDLLDDVLPLRDDGVPRVRAAAQRAVAALTSARH
jgi:HEAT repeat protein